MQKLLFKTTLFFALATLGLASCSDSKDAIDEEFIQTAHIVSGKVEKGPLVRGSQIDMRTLDKTMVPTGESYTTTIENNTGEFNYGSLKVNSPYAKFTADGYFFNEVNGSLSNSTIKLDALVDLSDNTSVNVNVLTHLKSQRINYLVTNKGKSFKEANQQAQKELLSLFGLQEYASKDASQFSIISDDDAAGVLIAVSSLILSDRSEAEIVEYLSLLSNEFSTTGKFSDTIKEKLKATRNYLNGKLEDISDNIKARYKELGYDVDVKDLAYFFDWDNDGIAGNELENTSTVKLSQNKIDVPSEGGDFTVNVESDKPYFLVPPSEVTSSDTGLDQTTGGSVTEEKFYNSLYEAGTNTEFPESEKKTSIENNVIIIHVGPAQSRKSSTWAVKVYNARGAVAAEISMSQMGNSNIIVKVPKLGSNGINVIAGTLARMRDAVKTEQDLEGKYALQESKRPYSASNSSINNCWGDFYSALNYLLSIKKADADALNCYQPFVNTYIALNYYLLSSHWGGLPFYTERRNSDNITMPRTDENSLLTNLSSLLKEAMPDLEEKKNESLADINNAFFVSRDVARVILAYIYCNQKKWDAALPLLEEVINKGYYSLTESNIIHYKNDSECILGLVLQTRASNSDEKSCYPCLDYKDVILTTAECLYHTGNTAKAKEYINLICKKKSIVNSETDVLKSIAMLRYKIQTPNYLAFIRRNNLGTSFMGLNSNQTYQLLWPIPSSECASNPAMTQNPGY